MGKPVIGITLTKTPRTSSKESYFKESPYVKALINVGGIPRWIENDTPVEVLKHLLQDVDGILLSGGADIDPAIYNGEEHASVTGINRARDNIELVLARLVIHLDLPLFGICRGCQILNVALGGTLYSHIPDQYKTDLNHRLSEEKRPSYLAHEVSITPGSLLAGIVRNENIWVNSRHHQAINRLAPTLTVTARATDDLIEGIERPSSRFCLAVQWHPENLQDAPEQQRLFASFVEAAGNNDGRRF